MNCHADQDAHCTSIAPSSAVGFPSTPSPSAYYRRPSVASACSWEAGLSYSSDISLHSPATPQADEGTSPGDAFVPANHCFNGMNSDVPAMPDFGSPYTFEQDESQTFAAKGLGTAQVTSQEASQDQFAPFEDVASPQTPQTTIGSTVSGLYQLPTYKLDETQPCYDLSTASTMPSWSTSPARASDSSTTVVPSQTLSLPQTPQASGRLTMPLSRGNNIPIGPAQDAAALFAFSTPSPSVSPTGDVRGYWAGTPTGVARMVSQPSTPTRRPTRAKMRTMDTELPRRWEPRMIYPKNEKKHKCRHPNCGGAFQRQEHLKRHETSHTGDRPHECRVAGCKFKGSRSDNLKQHMKRHRIPGGRVKYVPDLVID